MQLDEANKRLSKAIDLLLEGDIKADDYRIIKSETEEKINRFEAKLAVSVKKYNRYRTIIKCRNLQYFSIRCFI